MLWLSIALLTFVTLQRLAELIYARHNTAALLARGAREYASEHYPFMVALHAAWLIGLWLFAIGRPIDPGWFLLFMLLQGLRIWVLATLKGRWTTRIIILPGAALVTSGPYRFLSHPNYAIVIGEIAVLPLAFGLPVFAAIFSLLNGIILAIRIRAENACLKQSAA
ncbi:MULTISPECIES: isoprenylcysteine carboxylmethyltransferase family protein [Rhizobium]|uniref:Methyltransferase n=1 Tax=Rhizobium tropici TaxID=398 RepID=A0A329Y5L6_RHITR|nr:MULTISPECIES: isoprenylcysteine carboxylmethyltransferase family protein [Rhizobium]MBB3288683.1 methyltransferase [Rhizobium sp. BK252]MBB3403180.1 methyltransferase [Rhizobium sp. BK289]MBB3415755.1 methyltransferase [Rhizobium sp. BK284]MBB3483643.1 methyltransferase [Rhizobium sp. BK347]MDK4722376.1 isoprenylcysteine carboxylmethyltransferase family protein [Rhizobium sp. CNPSo 3968]